MTCVGDGGEHVENMYGYSELTLNTKKMFMLKCEVIIFSPPRCLALCLQLCRQSLRVRSTHADIPEVRYQDFLPMRNKEKTGGNWRRLRIINRCVRHNFTPKLAMLISSAHHEPSNSN